MVIVSRSTRFSSQRGPGKSEYTCSKQESCVIKNELYIFQRPREFPGVFSLTWIPAHSWPYTHKNHRQLFPRNEKKARWACVRVQIANASLWARFIGDSGFSSTWQLRKFIVLSRGTRSNELRRAESFPSLRLPLPRCANFTADKTLIYVSCIREPWNAKTLDSAEPVTL